MNVYHHTSLAHLPYILADDELVASSTDGDWPTDFVWTTSNPNGDRTVAACRQKRIPRARLTFNIDDFEPWQTRVDSHQDWTPRHKAMLLDAAAELGQPNTDCWFVAPSGLSLETCCNIEIKTWDSRWRTGQPILEKVRFVGDAAEFVCLGSRYAVMRAPAADGRLCYMVEES